MRRFRHRRGASLPEILTVATIFALMLGGMLTLGVTSTNQWTRGTVKMTVDNSASLALQSLAEEARAGIRAYTNTSGTELTVVLPATNSQGDYNRFVEGSSIRYYLSNGSLCRQVGTATPTVIGRRLTSSSFTVNGPQVRLRLSAQQRIGSRMEQTVLTTQVTLRNEATD